MLANTILHAPKHQSAEVRTDRAQETFQATYLARSQAVIVVKTCYKSDLRRSDLYLYHTTGLLANLIC